MLSDNERYEAWLRDSQFTNITARVNVAFIVLEQEGKKAWPRFSDLPVQDPNDSEVWSWMED